jgi:hypothetical protein
MEEILKRQEIKRLGIYVVPESPRYAMNTALNMRHKIQKKLEPRLGRNRAEKWAVRIVMLFEEPLKVILCKEGTAEIETSTQG